MSVPSVFPPVANPGGAANNIVSFIRSPTIPKSGIPKAAATGLRLPSGVPQKVVSVAKNVEPPKVPGIPMSSLQMLDPLMACELGLGPCANHTAKKALYPFTGGQSPNVLYKVEYSIKCDFKLNSSGKIVTQQTAFWRLNNVKGPITGFYSGPQLLKQGTIFSKGGSLLYTGVFAPNHAGGGASTGQYLYQPWNVSTVDLNPYTVIAQSLPSATITRMDGQPDTGGNPPSTGSIDLSGSGTATMPMTIATITVPDTVPDTVPTRVPDPDEGNEVKPFTRPPSPTEPQPSEEPDTQPVPVAPPEPETPEEEEGNPDPPPAPTKIPVPSTPNEEPLEEPFAPKTPKPEFEPIPAPDSIPKSDPPPTGLPSGDPISEPEEEKEESDPQPPSEPKAPPTPTGDPTETPNPVDDPFEVPDTGEGTDLPLEPTTQPPSEPQSPPPTTDSPSQPSSPPTTSTPPPKTSSPPASPKPETDTSNPPPPNNPPPPTDTPAPDENPDPISVPVPAPKPPTSGTPPTNNPLPTPKNPPLTPPPPPMGCSACEQAIQTSVDDVKTDTAPTKEKADQIKNDTNNILLKLDALLDAMQTTQLEEVLDRLGPKVDGGLSGFLTKAWQATQMDKVLNYLNTILLAHNAAMLSRNLGETLGDTATAILQFLNIKDHEGNNIDVVEVLGDTIQNTVKAILGEETYTGISQRWNQLNRIISAAAGVVNALQGMMHAAIEGLNTIASWIAKMGNKFQEQGLVDDLSWDWMDEHPNFKNPYAKLLDQVDSLDDAANSVYQVVSAGIEIQQGVTETVEASTELSESLQAFTTEKTTSETTLNEESKSPVEDHTKVDLAMYEVEASE